MFYVGNRTKPYVVNIWQSVCR